MLTGSISSPAQQPKHPPITVLRLHVSVSLLRRYQRRSPPIGDLHSRKICRRYSRLFTNIVSCFWLNAFQIEFENCCSGYGKDSFTTVLLLKLQTIQCLVHVKCSVSPESH